MTKKPSLPKELVESGLSPVVKPVKRNLDQVPVNPRSTVKKKSFSVQELDLDRQKRNSVSNQDNISSRDKDLSDVESSKKEGFNIQPKPVKSNDSQDRSWARKGSNKSCSVTLPRSKFYTNPKTVEKQNEDSIYGESQQSSTGEKQGTLSQFSRVQNKHPTDTELRKHDPSKYQGVRPIVRPKKLTLTKTKPSILLEYSEEQSKDIMHLSEMAKKDL